MSASILLNNKKMQSIRLKVPTEIQPQSKIHNKRLSLNIKYENPTKYKHVFFLFRQKVTVNRIRKKIFFPHQ